MGRVKICIEVSGALVQNVYAICDEGVNAIVDVTVCDFDLVEDRDVSDKEAYEICREFDAFISDPGCFRVW